MAAESEIKPEEKPEIKPEVKPDIKPEEKPKEQQKALVPQSTQDVQTVPKDYEQIKTTLTTLQQENESLKAQIMQSGIDATAQRLAVSLGVSASAVAYITRLADFKSVVNAKGEIDEKLMTEALSKVLTDLPQLKADEQKLHTGFNKIGGAGAATPEPSKPQGTQKRWNRFNH